MDESNASIFGADQLYLTKRAFLRLLFVRLDQIDQIDGSLGAFGHAVTIGGLSFQHRGVWVVGMTPPDYMYFPSNNNPLGWFIEGIPRAKADSSDIFYPKEHHIHEQRDTTHLPLRHLEKIGALHWRSTQQLSFLYRRMGRFGKLLMPRPPPFPRD